MFFIAFGLLMALAWVRLQAPDVALAEAAIGAGLTGALLLAALSRLNSIEHTTAAPAYPQKSARALQLQSWLAMALLLILNAGLAYSILSLPDTGAGLTPLVTMQLEHSGVKNPVTAVLLNYRGYDTLLEVFVLLLALLSVWSMGTSQQQPEASPGPVLDNLMRLLAPVLILVAAYLLWVGADAPGGAFQAGSVLAAAGVLLLLSGWRLPTRLLDRPLRIVLIAGPAVFIATALATLLSSGRLLQFAPDWAGVLILLIETFATHSIGVTLAALFAGGRPHHPPDRS